MDLHKVLSAVKSGEAPSVLATIIGVEGHSYRKAGAAMLFRLEGEPIGSISPGCLEADLRERVPAVWSSGKAESVEYNMRPEEDALWGEAIGCGGRITVLLEPVLGMLRSVLLEAVSQLEAGGGVTLSRFICGDSVEYMLSAAETDLEEFAPGPEQTNGKTILFRTVLLPQPRLLVFGAGEDAVSVYEACRRIGFRISIADWREGLLLRSRFPDADLVAGAPEEVAGRLAMGAADYAIICSHQLGRDREMLVRLLPLGLRYIGIVGSCSRIRHLFEGLDAEPRNNVYAPVGLGIGAEGPEEIAVSIAAELIAVRKESRADRARGGGSHQNRRHLFGGRREFENGRAQAVARVVARHNGR